MFDLSNEKLLEMIITNGIQRQGISKEHNATHEDDIRSSSCGSWTLNYVGDCVSTHAMKSLKCEADLEVELTDAATMMHGCTIEWASTVFGWITTPDSLPHFFSVSPLNGEEFLVLKQEIRPSRKMSIPPTQDDTDLWHMMFTDVIPKW